jgi:Undecaprenyl-phosphate glucose phosphotransferase
MFVSALEADKRRSWHGLTLGSGAVGALAALAEIAAIATISVITGAVWHMFAYGGAWMVQPFVDVGILTGLLYVLPFLLGSEYRVDHFLGGQRSLARILNVWTTAFFALAALAFLTKTTGSASRGALALFFVLGGVTVIVTDAALRRLIKALVALGLVAPRRLLIVGRPEAVAGFVAQHSPLDSGVEIAGTVTLSDGTLPLAGAAGPGSDDRRTDAALDKARTIGANDVLILLGESDKADMGARLADRFMDLPVGVHLGQHAIAAHFPRLHVSRIGKARTLALRGAPLDPYQRAVKRIFDAAFATLGIFLLSPILLIVAALIKLDSPGPVFFRQRRRGYNQREFAIWKFRTMTTMDDGATIKQAVANDPRVTRVGKYLRKFNIDELPQLINVIEGTMSLVGPRPHAVAHDRHYERVIRRYGRRLNVKPGITGWAQVNGYRGLTDTDHAMRSRITHDLYYIDNWSIMLDLYIIVLTVLSPKAFRNAT